MGAEHNSANLPELLSRCRERDDDGWQGFVGVWWPVLLALVGAHLNRWGVADPDLKEEIAQRVLCSLIDGFGNRLAKYDAERGPFSQYLRLLVRKVLYRHWRSEKRRRTHEMRAAAHRGALDGRAPTVAEVVSALAQLTGELSDRQIAVVQQYLGLAPAGGAALPSGASLRMLLSRMRRKLELARQELAG